jgi:hypothetical protein
VEQKGYRSGRDIAETLGFNASYRMSATAIYSRRSSAAPSNAEIERSAARKKRRIQLFDQSHRFNTGKSPRNRGFPVL